MFAPGWRGFFLSGRDRVKSPCMPRMAFAQPANSQKQSLNATMNRNGFNGILGTCRIETAILPQKGANAQLIEAQGQKQKPLQRRLHGFLPFFPCAENSCLISDLTRRLSNLPDAGALLATIGEQRRTTQSIASISFCRNTSRQTRLTAFLVAARGAKRLAMTSPRRARGKPRFAA